MSHNTSGANYMNNMNNININTNLMNKFNKINRQNFKTISIHNSSASNYTKYNHSKDNTQLTNNLAEKKKKSSSNKKSTNKKEKKNCIPKIKTDIINGQSNNEMNLENIINNNLNNNNINSNSSNTNSSSINNNLKSKKEYIQSRHNSSHHQKSNDIYDKNSKEINILRKKILTGNTNNNINHNGNINNTGNIFNNNNGNPNKYIPRSNDRINNMEVINNGNNNKAIKRSHTNNYKNENWNCNNASNEIGKYKNIIKILLYYIENLNKKIKYFFNKNQIEKNNKIKELSLQNKFLLNENIYKKRKYFIQRKLS